MKYLPTILVLCLISCNAPTEITETEKSDTTNTLELKVLRYGGEISFRGLQLNTNGEIWASGSKSTLIHSVDSGKSWTSLKVVEGTFDFRYIEVIQDTIVLMNAGTPCLILRTTNMATTWDTVYYHADSNAFLNGIDFSTKGHGVAYGDAITDKMMFLQSLDFGKTWEDESETLPQKKETEVGFAASGSGILIIDSSVYIGTGGDAARIYQVNERTLEVKVIESNMLSGNDSRGIYAMAAGQNKHFVAVGGSWKEDRQSNTIIYSDDGKTWKTSDDGNRYLSSVCYAGDNTFIACGPSGVIISRDLGIHWTQVSTRGYNVIQVDTNSGFGILAGTKGEIARFMLK